jgi:hypothetical protein
VFQKSSQAIEGRHPQGEGVLVIGHMARLAALLEALPQPIVDFILERRF